MFLRIGASCFADLPQGSSNAGSGATRPCCCRKILDTRASRMIIAQVPQKFSAFCLSQASRLRGTTYSEFGVGEQNVCTLKQASSGVSPSGLCLAAGKSAGFAPARKPKPLGKSLARGIPGWTSRHGALKDKVFPLASHTLRELGLVPVGLGYSSLYQGVAEPPLALA